MPRSITRSVRYAFAALTGGLLLLAGVQSAATEARMGLSTCGWEGNPCVLEALVIEAPAAAGEADGEFARAVSPPRRVADPLPAAQS